MEASPAQVEAASQAVVRSMGRGVTSIAQETGIGERTLRRASARARPTMVVDAIAQLQQTWHEEDARTFCASVGKQLPVQPDPPTVEHLLHSFGRDSTEDAQWRELTWMHLGARTFCPNCGRKSMAGHLQPRWWKRGAAAAKCKCKGGGGCDPEPDKLESSQAQTKAPHRQYHGTKRMQGELHSYMHDNYAHALDDHIHSMRNMFRSKHIRKSCMSITFGRKLQNLHAVVLYSSSLDPRMKLICSFRMVSCDILPLAPLLNFDFKRRSRQGWHS